jgi:ArsR family transcriptional regulator, arsenate/arsenite/antimonite-responsive transcriptional repressor
MQEGLGIPGTTLSFHLKELTSAGLVSQERASRNLVYRPHITQMNWLMGYLTQNCCEGAACGLEPTAMLCDC